MLTTRIKIHNLLSKVCKVSIVQDLKGHITEDTIVLQRLSPQISVNNSLCGWSSWAIYIYTPHSPMTLDRLVYEVKKTLHENGIEITNVMGGEFYDDDIRSYVTTVSCRTPDTLID